MDTESSIVANDLRIVRLKTRKVDLFVRTGSNYFAEDRRHLGPTILRLEWADNVKIGTIPKTISSDAPDMLNSMATNRIVRHISLLCYRWRYGLELLHPETIGYVPVLRKGNLTWLPNSDSEHHIVESAVVSTHRYTAYYASGWAPTWHHFSRLCRTNLPKALHWLFAEKSLKHSESDIV